MANFVSNDNATSLMNAINQKKDSKPTTITWAEWIALTDEQREGTHYIITNVPARFSDKDAVFSIKNQTLTFTNKVATVTDARVTTDTYIFTFYHDQAVAQAAGIQCSWTTGTITFTVADNPASDIVVDILCIIPALATPKEDITAEDVSYDNTKNVKQKIDEAIGLASNKSVYNGLFPTFSLSGIQTIKVIDQNITLTEEHVVLITIATYVTKANNGSFYIPLYVDNVDQGNILLLSQTISTFISTSYAVKLSAGEHNIRIDVGTDNAAATASNESFRRGMYTIAVL